MPTIRPSDRPILYTVLAEEPISDVTRVGDLTGVSEGLQVVSDADENAYLGALSAVADAFPPLPPMGTWLEAGKPYQHGDGVVVVRQDHTRTEHEPATVPALFLVWRVDAGSTLEWVAGEQVQVGTLRTYGGATYRCIQAHVTQADWTPPAVPALWAVVEEPQEPPQEPDEPQPWKQPTGSHDVYHIGDRVTYNGYIWECTAGDATGANAWPPGVYGWEQIGPL